MGSWTTSTFPRSRSVGETFVSEQKSSRSGERLSGSSAVVTRDGDGFSIVARTGDPLPTPLAGTFNEFTGQAVVGDGGDLVFGATLNSSASA